MKDLKKLDRSIFWSECVHLALLTLCLAIPIALIFDAEEGRITHLPWAFGAVLPVQLVRLICQRINQKGQRFLLCMAVLAVTMLLTHREHRWISYLVPLLVILFSGLILPRHKGKLLFTIPTPFTLILTLIAYIIGTSLSVPLLPTFSVLHAALLTINFLIHTNLVRLKDFIRLSVGSEIALTGIVRQNYKLITVYALIGVVVIVTMPFLIQREQTPIGMTAVAIEVEETRPRETAATQEGYAESTPAVVKEAAFVGEIVFAVIFAVGILALLVLLFLLGKNTLERIDRKKAPELKEGLYIENLEEEEAKVEREKLTGWEKKIRRRYEKLILRLTRVDAALLTLTPAELETAAGISRQPENAELHAIYEQTRYGAGSPSKEDYRRFKDCAKTLESKTPKLKLER